MTCWFVGEFVCFLIFYSFVICLFVISFVGSLVVLFAPCCMLFVCLLLLVCCFVFLLRWFRDRFFPCNCWFVCLLVGWSVYFCFSNHQWLLICSLFCNCWLFPDEFIPNTSAHKRMPSAEHRTRIRLLLDAVTCASHQY